MARVKFARDYNHMWPSRAVTAYKRGWEGPVKAEVEEAARAAGALAPDTLPGTHQELGEIAAAEGVTFGADVRTVADKQAAILAARKPAPTLPGNLPPDLAEPQALTPNLHVDEPADSK